MLGFRHFASSGESVGGAVVTREHTRFDAFKLAARGAELAGSVDPASLPRVGERVAEAGGRLDWRIRGGEDGQGRPALTVMLEGEVPLACQRCLGTMRQGVAQQTTLLLARDDAELVRLDEASEYEVVLAGAPIEALGLVEDELLLSLPFAPRHEEGCGADAAARD
jgi:uncharacterized protein